MKKAIIQTIDNISEISNISQYDFIVSVLTSWQFDVALAYLRSHRLNNGVLIVETVPFSDVVRYRLSEEQVLKYEGLFSGIYFCQNRKQPYQIGNLIKCLFSRDKKKPMYWLRPLPRISLRLLSNIVTSQREIHYVALDEGLTSYMPYIDTLKILYPNTFKVYSIWFVQKALNAISSRYIKEQEEFGLFHSVHSQLEPNKEACAALEQVYKERVQSKKETKECILFFKDYLVIPDEQAIRIFDAILEGIKDSGVNIIIKKHPSDTDCSFDDVLLSKYPNIRIINSVISGEELVATYEPELIVGGFSTVVISSSFIYSIPTISFSGIYLQDRIVSPLHEKQIKLFMNQLDDYIPFCRSTSEVCEKIEKNIITK